MCSVRLLIYTCFLVVSHLSLSKASFGCSKIWKKVQFREAVYSRDVVYWRGCMEAILNLKNWFFLFAFSPIFSPQCGLYLHLVLIVHLHPFLWAAQLIWSNDLGVFARRSHFSLSFFDNNTNVTFQTAKTFCDNTFKNSIYGQIMWWTYLLES